MPAGGQKKSSSQQQQQKQGGNLVSDIQNLAVPFAILLAKQGLEGVFKSKPEKPVKATKKPSSAKKAPAAEAKPKTTQRRKTISGGGASCTSAAGCAGLKGGNASCGSKKGGNSSVGDQFNQIATEVQSFLKKYSQ